MVLGLTIVITTGIVLTKLINAVHDYAVARVEGSDEVSETKDAELEWLVRELRILPDFATGTWRDGKELVPLADFMRERIAKALTMAADRLEGKS